MLTLTVFTRVPQGCRGVALGDLGRESNRAFRAHLLPILRRTPVSTQEWDDSAIAFGAAVIVLGPLWPHPHPHPHQNRTPETARA